MFFETQEKGTRKTYYLEIPKSTQKLKTTVIKGSGEGKTLVITAGIHGCEYTGIEAAKRLCSTLDPLKVSGTVVILPTINLSGFYAGARAVVPEDNKNLNQVFPGNKQGTLAERIAYTIEQEVYPVADFLIDLHSGDIQEMAMPFVYFSKNVKEEVKEIAIKGAESMSLSVRVGSTSSTGLYSYAGVCGIPALLYERSGHGERDEETIEVCINNMYELMQGLDLMQEKPVIEHVKETSLEPQKEVLEAVYDEAVADGFWRSFVKAGETFEVNTLLGELRDEDDQVIQESRAAFKGIVLYMSVVLGTAENDPLIAYGRIE